MKASFKQIQSLTRTLTRNEMQQIAGGTNAVAGVCDDWRTKPNVCYNCCITVYSWDYCAGQCPRKGGPKTEA